MAQHETPVADGSIEARRHSVAVLPEQVVATFDGEINRLVGLGVPAGVATAGAPMPDGDLLDVHGAPTTLAKARGDRPAVVVFYRGAWCPYCNVALRAYQRDLLGELDARGVGLIAISPQRPDESLSLAQKHDLGYTVLSDPGNQIAGQLGVVFTHTEAARDAQRSLGLDVATTNADGTYALPLTTTVVVDTHGTIRWIDVRPDYTRRTEPAEIIAALALI